MRYTITFAIASLIAAPLWAEVPKVVTDIAPVHSLVAMVMGDLGTPVLLLDQGADPHDFQLRPSQLRALAGVDLVVWIGPQMTPWLEGALETVGATARPVALLTVPATGTRTYDFADRSHDHAYQDAEDPLLPEGTDPHVWLDPWNAQGWLTMLAAILSLQDPANAATYRANAFAASARIQAMDAAIAAQLAPVRDRPFIVHHDALGYFADHFHLTAAGAIAAGDAAPPGARRLRDQTAAAGQVVCVFPEVGHDTDLARQVAEASGAKLGVPLDPEGVMLEPGPTLYPALMTGLADALVDCLGS